MKLKTSTLKRRLPCPLICRICGDIARGSNYSVISCMSCKMFFRRHAEFKLLKQRCYFDGKCVITERTRKLCVVCRFKKCLETGMTTKLIRHSSPNISMIQLPQPRSLSLLDTNRSILTTDEWNFLANIIRTYDEQNLSLQVFSKTHWALPPKIRCKDSSSLSHIESLFSRLYTFIERCPLFYSLSFHVRKILIKRNLGALGSLNGLFMAKGMNTMESEMYSTLLDNIYGKNYSKRVIQASQRLDQNGTLIKIMLMIIMFSNNCTIVSVDLSENAQIIFNPKLLFYIQNIFVDVLWKYLICQYEFKEAVLKLMSLVKSLLDMIQRMADGLNIRKHWTMLEKVIEEKICSLSLEETISSE